jgi:hypothetical protein
MTYVLDACVALKWVLVEPDSAKARQLRDEFRNAIHELIAPDSFTTLYHLAGIAAMNLVTGFHRFRIPVGRRAKIFTAEDAEGAERKTEGKRERIEVGRASPDGSRPTAA